MCLLSVSVVILPALSQSCAEDLLLPPNGAVPGEHGAVNAAPLNTSPPPATATVVCTVYIQYMTRPIIRVIISAYWMFQ